MRSHRALTDRASRHGPLKPFDLWRVLGLDLGVEVSAASYAWTVDSPTASRTREAYVRANFGGELA